MPGRGDGGDARPASGLFASLRRLLATLLEVGQVRLDLLSAEFESEKLRIYDGLLWGAVALMFIGLGLLLLAALLVALAPDNLRLLLLGLLALGSLGLGVWLVLRTKQRLSNGAGALAATRAELERDRAALRAGD